MSTAFSILSKEPFDFDWKSLHSSLYISTDNKVISNRKKTFVTYKDFETYYSHIFTKRNTFSVNDERVGLSIEYEIQEEDTDNVLEIGFGVYKNSSFQVSIMLNLILCFIRHYFFLVRNSYFLKDQDTLKPLYIANSLTRLYIHYHSDGIFEIYFRGYFWNYGYLKTKHKVELKFPTRFFVRWKSGTEVKIKTGDTGTLFDMGFPLLMDFLSGIF